MSFCPLVMLATSILSSWVLVLKSRTRRHSSMLPMRSRGIRCSTQRHLPNVDPSTPSGLQREETGRHQCALRPKSQVLRKPRCQSHRCLKRLGLHLQVGHQWTIAERVAAERLNCLLHIIAMLRTAAVLTKWSRLHQTCRVETPSDQASQATAGSTRTLCVRLCGELTANVHLLRPAQAYVTHALRSSISLWIARRPVVPTQQAPNTSLVMQPSW
mmetsp:Transcript_8104/g.25298  ORF Transcript_8104/g.25298 Transcript_8104/m.25298 type:complete len:215 (-) Transcript_8104:871-1515(-)